jgi:hypothetical protein
VRFEIELRMPRTRLRADLPSPTQPAGQTVFPDRAHPAGRHSHSHSNSHSLVRGELNNRLGAPMPAASRQQFSTIVIVLRSAGHRADATEGQHQ